MAMAVEEAVTLLAACQWAGPVRAPTHDILLPAGAEATWGERLAGRTRARMAGEDAMVRAAEGGVAVWVVGFTVERVAAGLPTGVWGEVEVVGGIMAGATEAGVVEIVGGDELDRLATRAAPGV